VSDTNDLDKPIYGAKAIGEEANLTERQAFWGLEKGHIPADKMGRKWVTTRRRLRNRFNPEQAVQTQNAQR
jgi:hypothetical protein